MSSDLGQSPIDYVHHDDCERATALQTQARTADGRVQIHTAGGFSRLEHAAIEIAKAAAKGATCSPTDIESQELGRWASQVASTILTECERLERSESDH